MFKKAFRRITGRSLKKPPSLKKKPVKTVRTSFKKRALSPKRVVIKKESITKPHAIGKTPEKILTAEGWKRLLLKRHKASVA